jgi:soluble lytic murein transglycosylase-like protein
VRYLAYLRDRFSGNLRTATIAYNQGEGNVARDTYQTWYYESVSKHYHNMISLSTTSR